MSRDVRRRIIPDSSHLGEVLSETIMSGRGLVRSRGPSLSTQESFSARDGLGNGLEASGRFPSFNQENGGDGTRATMQTRLAVRDKTPHRFQVIPLRDASKYGVTQSELSTKLATHSHNQRAHLLCLPSGKPASFCEMKTLESLPPLQPPEKDAWNERPDSRVLGQHSSQHSVPNKTVSLVSDVDFQVPTRQYNVGRRLLSEVDLNRERRPSVTWSSSSNAAHDAPLRPSQGLQTVNPTSSGGSVASSARSTTTAGRTNSRSLGLRACYGRSHPMSQSLSDFDPSRLSLLDFYTDRKGLVPNDSQDELTSKAMLRKDEQITEDSQPNRRHAVYSESAFLPYIHETDRPSGHVRGLQAVTEETTALAPARRDPALQTKPDQHQKYSSLQTDSESFSTLVPHGVDTSLDSQAAPRRIPRDHIETELPHAPASHLWLPTKPLSCRKNSNTKPLTSCAGPHVDIGTVYPEIVLDIFADIDVAIQEWNTLC